jgi:predicted secreted protein
VNIPFMIAVYFIIWWVVLFAVLPFGVRTQAEAGDVVPGTPGSAPVSFPIWRVIAITSVASGAVFAILWAAVAIGVIDIDSLLALPPIPQ